MQSETTPKGKIYRPLSKDANKENSIPLKLIPNGINFQSPLYSSRKALHEIHVMPPTKEAPKSSSQSKYNNGNPTMTRNEMKIKDQAVAGPKYAVQGPQTAEKEKAKKASKNNAAIEENSWRAWLSQAKEKQKQINEKPVKMDNGYARSFVDSRSVLGQVCEISSIECPRTGEKNVEEKKSRNNSGWKKPAILIDTSNLSWIEETPRLVAMDESPRPLIKEKYSAVSPRASRKDVAVSQNFRPKTLGILHSSIEKEHLCRTAEKEGKSDIKRSVSIKRPDNNVKKFIHEPLKSEKYTAKKKFIFKENEKQGIDEAKGKFRNKIFSGRQDGRNFLQRMQDDLKKRKTHIEQAQKTKQQKIQEEFERVEATNIHKTKLSPQQSELLIVKLTQDAERRRKDLELKVQKKQEEEHLTALEMANIKFTNKESENHLKNRSRKNSPDSYEVELCNSVGKSLNSKGASSRKLNNTDLKAPENQAQNDTKKSVKRSSFVKERPSQHSASPFEEFLENYNKIFLEKQKQKLEDLNLPKRRLFNPSDNYNENVRTLTQEPVSDMENDQEEQYEIINFHEDVGRGSKRLITMNEDIDSTRASSRCDGKKMQDERNGYPGYSIYQNAGKVGKSQPQQVFKFI